MHFDNFGEKVAIVTGAGWGIGKAIALAFAKQGTDLYINDIIEERIRDTEREIKSMGGRVTAITADTTISENVASMVHRAVSRSGKIDILVNNVGGSPGLVLAKGFLEHEEEFGERVIELNLKSTIMFCRAVLEGMIERKYGKIINISSSTGKIGLEYQCVYSAAKGGVIAFTKALAREMAKYNINVNSVCPGPIDTPAFAIVFDEKPDLRKAIIDRTPMCRMGKPEEVASCVLFLASDEASYITGQAISVDGGRTMI
jgi:2-hydroxycyclohexanecarboxyl-CoA dehydrogenase